ncbi:MAG: hypothetical protein ABIS14_01660 [Sphingomonas sp.]
MELDPPPLAPAPVEPAQPVARRWQPFALLALAAFVAGLAAMAVAFHYRDRWMATPVAVPTTQPATDRTPPIVPATTASVVSPGPSLDALVVREEQLAAQLAGIEARTATVVSDAQAASGNAGRAEALMIAFAARRAIDRGEPLGYLEPQLRARFGAVRPAEVGAIVQAARNPVTIEDLRAGLDGVAPLLITGAESEGWLASFRREIGNLVSVHRAATPSPLPADRLARARRLLEAGQVEAALAEVARMPGVSSATAWTDAARRYVGARRALDRLEATALG